jgi:hypothetical protein
MKKIAPSESDQENRDDLLPEYQFDYNRARPNRFASHLPQDQITVTLDPDVAAVFTTTESVNKALRALMSAMPEPAGVAKPTRKRPPSR